VRLFQDPVTAAEENQRTSRRSSVAVDVQCQDVFSTFQNDALRALKIDVGFLRPPVDTLHLQSQPLFKERFMALLPKSSRLAKRKKYG
jgi:DNA-binding transcriptional LysR family regulator